MFEIGSYVVYRAEGVCVVSDIRSESFGAIGTQEDYYILTPLRDERSVFFVPINNQNLVSYMRELLSARQIMQLVSDIKDERLEWIDDSRARSAAFREILSEGDRVRIAVLLNTLYEKTEQLIAQGKKMGAGNESLLQRAEKMLFDEFCVTTDIRSQEDIARLLRGEVELGERN